jgi:hypothetical protein
VKYYKTYIYKKNDAQVLLITLFIIALISSILFYLIILVGNAGNNTVNSRLYNQALTASESLLQDNVKSILNQPDLSTLSARDDCLNIIDGRKYECLLNLELLGIENQVILTFEDKRFLTDYTILKDETFVVSLEDYKGNYIIDMYDDIALEIGLIYSTNLVGTEKILTTVFDKNSHTTSMNNPPMINSYSFPENNALQTFSVNTSNWLANASENISQVNLKYLLLTPRSVKEVYSAKINFRPEQANALPYQVREIKTKSTYLNFNQGNAPVVELVTYLPLNDQFENIFFYNIFVENGI